MDQTVISALNSFVCLSIRPVTKTLASVKLSHALQWYFIYILQRWFWWEDLSRGSMPYPWRFDHKVRIAERHTDKR